MAPGTLFRFSRGSRWLGVAGVLMLAALLGRAAEGPPAKPARDGKPAADSRGKNDKSVPPRGLERLKLPANAIVVLVEEFEQGMRLVPRGVFLKEEKYRELNNRIAELERQLKPDRPVSPSTCKLKVVGAVQEDVINLKAEFQFKPKLKDTLIALGCQGANPKKAELDGKETLLQNTEDGLVVQADAGEHTLVLELEVAVVPLRTVFLAGGADWGFKLDLPRAALTTLEFEQLPGEAKEVRCNERVLHKAGEVIGLGPVDRLNVTWRKPVSPLVNGPLLAEQGAITVRVEEKEIVTQAQLTLQDQRGQAARWLLQTPPQASVELLPLKDKDLPAPAHTLESDSSARDRVIHTIQLKEPSADPLRVAVTVRRARADGRVPIGPFRLLDDKDKRQPAALMSQQGTILIVAPPDVRLSYHWPGASQLRVSKEEFTEEELRKKPQAKFHYWAMQAPVSPRAVPAVPILLELEIKTVPGVVETQVEHTLVLTRAGAGWEVEAVTRIHARPRRAGVDALEVQLPRTWPEWLRGLACWPRPGLPVNLVLTAWPWDGRKDRPPPQALQARYELRGATPGDLPIPDAFRRARISLGEKQDRAFTVTLTGVYRLGGGANQALLELPRPLNTLDRGGQVEVVVDRSAAGQELLIRELDQELPSPAARKHTLASETAPAQVEFAWRPHRIELPITVETDITLRDQVASVRQRFHFPATPGLPARASFHFPRGSKPTALTLAVLNQDLEIKVGTGKLKGFRVTATGLGPVPLKFGADRTVTLDYHIPLSASGQVTVPLFWPDQATQAETKVRVWSESGATVVPLGSVADRPWREEKIEVVAGHDVLPILVLRGFGRDLPLTLQVRESALPSLATVVVRRALIQATGDPDRRQTYRARFLISQWNTQALEVELPAPGSEPTLVRVDGKRVTPLALPTGAGKPGDRSTGTRFRLAVTPDRYKGPVVLDLHYRITPKVDPTETWGFVDRLHTTFYPPILRGAVFLGRVRWQVGLPAGAVLLNPGGEATTEQVWGWRGWLLAPQPGLSGAELEEWLTGARGHSPSEVDETALVCWQTAPTPILLVHVAQKTWLLGCSILLLALGLGLSFVPLSRGLFRVLCLTVVVLAGAAMAATAVFWPSTLSAVIYGSEPGAVVLVVILVVQWMLQRRYRRRLVFMPGFTRLKTGSVLTRGGSSNRPREPSTVDAPQTAESPSARAPAG